jgi:hypothetical protein
MDNGRIGSLIRNRDRNTVTLPLWASVAMEHPWFYLGILSKLCSDWLQTSIFEILAAFIGKNNSAMLPAASWRWAATEGQQI